MNFDLFVIMIFLENGCVESNGNRNFIIYYITISKSLGYRTILLIIRYRRKMREDEQILPSKSEDVIEYCLCSP